MFDIFFQNDLKALRKVRDEIQKLVDSNFQDTQKFWDLKEQETKIVQSIQLSHEKYNDCE